MDGFYDAAGSVIPSAGVSAASKTLTAIADNYSGLSERMTSI